MTTTTISEQIQALRDDLKDSQDLLAQVNAIEVPPSLAEENNPPVTKPPRVMLAFLMGLSVGLSLGAAGVAIAISLF